jgi:hypothetical protein
MTSALTYPDQLSAQTRSSSLDAAMGYPANGVPLGPGLHAPPAGARTLRYSAPIKHPTLSSWALPLDARATAYLTAAELAAVVTLGTDWTPAAQVIL